MNKGILYAAGGYVLWGLLPLYWKALQNVPALETLAHRMVWCLAFVLLLLASRRNWQWFRPVLSNPRIVLTFTASALLLTLNWFVYIWAVNTNHVVEASLGYFINPLVNVLLGMLFLKERLRLMQVIAIAVALGGVLVLTIGYGAIPWLALTLAITFGFYGLLRKTAALGSLEGLTVETLVLFLPALSFLLYRAAIGQSAFGNAGATTTVLLAGAGAVTAMPLLLFAAGARRITMTSLGILQYIAPTIQLMLGVLVYHEPFPPARLLGFSLIWLALAIYTFDGTRRASRVAALRPAAGKP